MATVASTATRNNSASCTKYLTWTAASNGNTRTPNHTLRGSATARAAK